jgi:GTP-binding protein EngB required for normal cell division
MVNARNSKMFTSEKLQAFLVDYLAKRANLDYSLAMVDIDSLPKVSFHLRIESIFDGFHLGM